MPLHRQHIYFPYFSSPTSPNASNETDTPELRICITSACLTHQNRRLQTVSDFGMPISIFQSRCLQGATARTAGACLSSP
ncbi:hypothetical protein N8667_04390, partial [Verrucomicrobia bacterium]|nr:hypothetical protein [Verrucomicrobiota bacterium]